VLDPLGGGKVVYNGVRDCGFAGRRTPTGRVGIIGRIAPEKGQHVFLEAARNLRGLRFVICGSTQFGDSRAEAYLRKLRPIAEELQVEITGWREDIASVLRELDLLVVPSLPFAEATTRVIPEAFAAGVPVLASDLPGIREIVEDGETGFLFRAGDSAALAARIREAMNAPGVVKKARQVYEQRFLLGAFQRRMVNIVFASARA
jgi:glycosyltransferase involved in cell wall biosynthesis